MQSGIIKLQPLNLDYSNNNILQKIHFTDNIFDIINIKKLTEIIAKNASNIIDTLRQVRGEKEFLLKEDQIITNDMLEKLNFFGEQLNIDRAKGIKFDMIVEIIKNINNSDIIQRKLLDSSLIQKTGGTNKDYKDISYLLIIKYLSLFGDKKTEVNISFLEEQNTDFVKLSLSNQENFNSIFIGYGNSLLDNYKKYKKGDIIIDERFGTKVNLDSIRNVWIRERYGDGYFKIIKI